MQAWLFSPFSSGQVKWSVCKNDFGLVNMRRLVCTRAIRCGVIDATEKQRNSPCRNSVVCMVVGL